MELRYETVQAQYLQVLLVSEKEKECSEKSKNISWIDAILIMMSKDYVFNQQPPKAEGRQKRKKKKRKSKSKTKDQKQTPAPGKS